jgi:hypothetical protein
MVTATNMATATGPARPSLPEQEAREPDRLIRSWVGRLLAVGGAALVLYAAVTVTLGNAFRDRNPALVVDYFGQNARALENLADAQIATEMRAGRLSGAERLARAAVSRDGTSVKAFRIIAIAAGLRGQERRADALLDHADALTRRDLGTRLLLIERSVARNDIRGTLRHYDLALRTSRSSFDVLAPVLSSAIADDGLREPIAQAFRANPPWLPAFLGYAIVNTPAPQNLALIMLASRDAPPVARRETVLAMTNRLIAEEQYRSARSFLAAMVPDGRRLNNLLRDSGFTDATNLAPFTWAIAESLNLGATAQPDGLSYYARPGQSGQVVRQLLTLTPGSYRLTTVGRNVSADPFGRAQWVLRCAGEQGRQLVMMDLPQGGEDRSAGTAFSVPGSGCTGQWLELLVRAGEDPGGVEGRVRTVDIRRAASRL